MGSVEQKARELLAESLRKHGRPRAADAVLRDGRDDFEESLDAIAAALREQPEARGVVDGWKPADVEPPHNPKKDSLGTEYLIHPPTSGGDRTAFYGRRLGGAACWYRYGAPVHGVDFWQELPADPAPPSAPVGVELDAAALGRFAQDEWMDRNSAYPAWGRLTEAEQAAWLAVGERIKRVVSLAQQPAQAAPGWKLVPEKITFGMWKAWEISNMNSGSYQEDYAAMLAAAPTPPGDDAAGGG